jgi:tetratricopeptide (TPR) repeat protein
MAPYGSYATSFWIAWVSERAGRLEDAEQGFRRLLAVYPDGAPARVRLLNVLLKEKQIDELFSVIDERLSKKPDDPTALYALGQLGSGGRRPADAERALRRFLEHPIHTPLSSPAGAHYFLGRALQSQHREEEAVAEYKKALELDYTMWQARQAPSHAAPIEECLRKATHWVAILPVPR